MKISRYILVALILLAITLASVSCGDSESTEPTATATQTSTTMPTATATPTEPVPGVTADTIKVGATGAFSGPYGFIGQIQESGAMAYINYINEHGGVHGRQIEYILYDDAFDPARTMSGVKRLVEQDEVFCLFNGGSSVSMEIVKDYVVENGVAFFGGITNDIIAVMPPTPGYYLCMASYYQAGQLMVEYMVDTLGIEKLGFLGLATGNALEGKLAINDELDKRGLELIEDIAVMSPPPSDWTPSLTKLKNAGVEGLFIWGIIENQVSALLSQAKAIDYHPVMIDRFPGSVTDGLIALAGDDANGMISTTNLEPLNSDSQAVKDFIARYQQYYPDNSISIAHEICYLNAVVLVEALERAGPDLTRENFIQAIESMDKFETGLGPPISFGPDRRFGMSAIGLMKIENGEIVRFGDWIEVGPAPEGVAERLEQ